MNGSCHIYKWESIPSFPFKRATQLIHMCDTMVMRCIWCHTYEWVMSHIWKKYVTWLIHICDMTHSYVWHDSFICVTWYVWHNSFISVTWLIHMCDTTHSYVWHDSFTCAACLIQMCDMTHPTYLQAYFQCVHTRSYISVSQKIFYCAHMWNVTDSCE